MGPEIESVIDFPIENLLPHRGELLLVSRVLSFDIKAGTIVTEYKVPDHPFWEKGHFPDFPVMPGFLIAENGAQSGAIFARICRIQHLPFLARADSLRFYNPVKPGQSIHTQANVIEWDGDAKRRVWKFEFIIHDSDHEKVASGLITGVVNKAAAF